jgi:hypothetical protein
MKFLVCRKDGVEGKVRTSELWPTIVECDADTPADQIVFMAWQKVWGDYIPIGKSYYVVPMDEAMIVSFRPKQNYEVIVSEVR